MRILLDTHVVLWWLLDKPALGRAGRDLIEADDVQVFVPDVAIWEIAIKHRSGKLSVSPEAADRALADDRFERLAIDMSHIMHVGRLPMHHRDPFDRMIIAQAQTLDCPVMTDDAIFARYGVEVVPCR